MGSEDRLLYDLYPAIIKTLESISTCSAEYGDWSWDSETLTKASGFLHQLGSFEFFITFCITMRVLSSLRSLTIKLQKKTIDIIGVYEHVSEVQIELELLSNCEEEFTVWYSVIKSLADDLNIPVTTPRIASRQVHRANVPAESPETYYRRNMIPFLDHITTELESRFGPVHQTKIKLLGLIPSVAATYPSASINTLRATSQ